MKPWRWLRAHLGGYFWAPCPVCGRMRGGHERRGGQLARADGRVIVTCDRCCGSYVEWQGRVWQARAVLDADGDIETILYAA